MPADKAALKAKMEAYYLDPVRCKICKKAIPFLASSKRGATLCGDQMTCRNEHRQRLREAKKQQRRRYYESERVARALEKRATSSDGFSRPEAIRLARKIARKRNGSG